jgi:hypothetical protein
MIYIIFYLIFNLPEKYSFTIKTFPLNGRKNESIPIQPNSVQLNSTKSNPKNIHRSFALNPRLPGGGRDPGSFRIITGPRPSPGRRWTSKRETPDS